MLEYKNVLTCDSELTVMPYPEVTSRHIFESPEYLISPNDVGAYRSKTQTVFT